MNIVFLLETAGLGYLVMEEGSNTDGQLVQADIDPVWEKAATVTAAAFGLASAVTAAVCM